jgi:threonine/homoserine/homoserine lactone efflux protein
MLTVHQLVTFGLTAWAIIIVPGPSVLFVVSRGVALGRKAALATVVGNAAGALTTAIIVALGLGSVVARSITIYNVVKFVGAAYIVYLGIQAFRHRKGLSGTIDAASSPRSAARIIREGYLVGVTNPKVIVFFGAVLPQFVRRDAGHVPLQMILLGVEFVAISLVSDGMWGLLAGTARAWLSRSPKRMEALGGAGGLVLVGLGLRLALTGRHD